MGEAATGGHLARVHGGTASRRFCNAARRTPLKALLLIQEFFPGVGNWMADEILWQACLHPRLAAGSLDDSGVRELFRVMRSVCRVALKTIGRNWSNPPADWLIHQRWNKARALPEARDPVESCDCWWTQHRLVPPLSKAEKQAPSKSRATCIWIADRS